MACSRAYVHVMAFREKDYLKKQIDQAARAIARALGFKDAGNIDEARAELDRGAKSVLGIGMLPLSRVDPASAVGLLRSRAKAEAYAELLEAQATIEDSEPLRERARAIRHVVSAAD